jgi:hypothetical protein
MQHKTQIEYDFTGECGCTLCEARKTDTVQGVPFNWLYNHLMAIRGNISRREFILMNGAED